MSSYLFHVISLSKSNDVLVRYKLHIKEIGLNVVREGGISNEYRDAYICIVSECNTIKEM